MDPQNAVQDLPVILVRPPRPGLRRRQQRVQPLPLLVGQVSSSHGTEMGIQTRNVSRLQTRPRAKHTVATDFGARKSPMTTVPAFRCEWWLGKFGQTDKWKICLRAARMPHIRSDNGETSTSDAQSGFQGEGGPGCHQGREDAGRPGAAV